jgi:hypothetical protein
MFNLRRKGIILLPADFCDAERENVQMRQDADLPDTSAASATSDKTDA